MFFLDKFFKMLIFSLMLLILGFSRRDLHPLMLKKTLIFLSIAAAPLFNLCLKRPILATVSRRTPSCKAQCNLIGQCLTCLSRPHSSQLCCCWQLGNHYNQAAPLLSISPQKQLLNQRCYYHTCSSRNLIHINLGLSTQNPTDITA